VPFIIIEKEKTMQEEKNAEQARLMKLQVTLTACILAVILIIGIFLAVKFTAIQQCFDTIEAKLEVLDVAHLNDVAQAFTDAAEQFNSVDMDQFNETVGALRSAADNLGGIDMTELNGAVSSLKDAARTLEKVDVNALNSLVQALESVAARLENAVNAITGIFH